MFPTRRVAATVALAFASAVYVGWMIAGVSGAAAASGALVLALGTRALWSRRPARPVAGGRATPFGTVFAQITDEVGVGFAGVDLEGAIIHANGSFRRLVASPRPVVGLKLSTLFQSQHRPAIEAALTEMVGGTGALKDLRVELAASGDAALITLGFSPQYQRCFCVLKDEGLQLRLEAQMRQATKMQAVGQLAGGLAHDFNNILTAIIGHCDLMLMRHGPGSMDHHDSDQIRQNANRAADLIRQLLAFSRQQTLRTRVVQIADVVGDLSHLLRRLLGEGVRLNVTQAAGLALVRIDPGQIEQVLVNLAVNACDAMPTGGSLTIATYAVAGDQVRALGRKIMPDCDYVAIAVTDTGEGIPKEIIANIFDPFFTTKDVGKGTGLGLAMAYGIVKQSGGFIFVDSAPGRGTRFTIYLPAATGAEVEAPAALPEPALEGWGQGTILLVEDEAMVRAVAARALTRSGYEVLAAECGEDALEILEARPDVDLLISDVVMLGMDGPTLVTRAQAMRPGLRALFISGYAEEQVRARVDDPGTPLLRKPFSIQELSAAVRARLAS